MQLDGAEVAAAEAAAVLDDGKLHLPDGGHTAHGLVDGVTLLPGVITGILSFVLLQVCMHVAEKRRKELDNPKDEE